MYQKSVLRNGIRVVTERMPHVHSVSTGIWVGVGSRDEENGERGITHFIEHMLFKGTQRRSALDIAKELDSVGGFSNAFTSKEQVCFHAKVLAKHLPLVVDVLTDIFRNSTFLNDEIEREQQVILQEIRMIEDTPDDFIHVLFQEMFWKDNPLGLPIYGTLDSVENIDRERIFQYASRTFSPERILIAATGNLDHESFVKLVEPSMGAMDFSEFPLDRRIPRDIPMVKTIQKDLEQVHLCLGMPATSQIDERRFACYLLNVILGSSMSSRLFQEIREKRGLAYSVYSFINSHADTGMLGVYAGIGPEKVGETIEVIHEQLALLANEPISDTELSAAKEQIKGSMYINAESTDSRMNRLAKNEFLFERYIPFEESEEKINSVTTKEIQEWFGSVYSPKRLGMLLLGPAGPDAEVHMEDSSSE